MSWSQKRKQVDSESERSLSEEPATSSGILSPDCKGVQLERAGSPVPTCHSMKSDNSMLLPICFREEYTGDSRVQHLATSRKEQSISLTLTKKSIQQILGKLDEGTMAKFKSHLCQDYPECFESESEDHNAIDIVERMLESCGREKSLSITLHILKNMDQKELANSLEKKDQKNGSIIRDQQKLQTNLKKKCACIFEGLAQQGRSTLLNEIYTELYITEGGSGAVINEHEVRQIEAASKRHMTPETLILCNDIFKSLPGQRKAIRTVLTKGIAGIGKTVSVQKFILDWAEEKANQDVHFIFTLPFRDLNLKKGTEFSLMQLLQHYFPELKDSDGIECDGVKVVFIFDGLDECRLSLDFQNNESWSSVTKSTSVDRLLTNLIKGNLLPSALLWITSRPAAANQIPPECVHRVTEIRGFSDPQKEEYFRKRIRDEHMTSRIISHIKSSRSLYTMCHIPVFCWISSTVLETMLGEANSKEIPTTVTGMYTHFLLIQTNVKYQKYHGNIETNPKKILESDREIILKLGELAFKQLQKGNLIFYEEDVRECGIDVNEASVYSGVCTELFKEELFGFHQEKVYCFVHLSIQEFMAALFVFYSGVNETKNVLVAGKLGNQDQRFKMSELHRTAVDLALQSENGHLDLLLRFLLGLSLEAHQTLLGGFLTQGKCTAQTIEETVKYINEKIRQESSAERTINLFHCLNELNDNFLVEEIQTSLKSGALSDKKLEPDQCSALAFVLLMSEDVLDVFNLNMYNTSAAGQERLMPVVKSCRRAILEGCDLSPTSCDIVASALQSVPSYLRELNLSYNNLGNSGGILLRAGLMSPNCKLQRLNLSYNSIGDSGVKLICAGLTSPNCKLQELNLSCNKIGDSGAKLLCDGLMSPNCKVQRLGLSGCHITEKGCAALASALCSNPSHLRELDLSYNHPRDSGVRELSSALQDPNCKLETLLLGWCNLTESCCGDLASVLRSPHSELRDLELRDNELQDSGVRALSAGLEDSHCKLERLGLSGCRVTETGCSYLASALHSNPTYLRELDLSYNHPGDTGVRALSARLEDPNYKIETLLVDHGEECRIKPGLRKYACQLTLDLNTINRNVSLSQEDRKENIQTSEEQPYPDHPERFDSCPQVLCSEGLCGRCYWEAEWSGRGVDIGVTYKGICRKGEGDECELGRNKISWSLYYANCRYLVCHNRRCIDIPSSPSPSHRVGVYLDWQAGTLSFYSVSSDTVTLMHRVYTTFTEPLYPGIGVYDSSVSLCQLE